MSSEILEILLSCALGLVVAYVVYVYLNDLHERWSNELAHEVSKNTDSPISDLYLAVSPEMFFQIRLGVTVALGVVGSIANILIGVVFALAGWFGPLLYLKRLRRRRVAKMEEQLIDALELLGNSLRSGMTLQQAVDLLIREFPPPISQEFGLVISETKVGVEFNDALQNMGARLKSNVVSILASGVAVTKRCGGDLPTMFDSIAQTIRDQVAIEGKLNAVTAQGRFQGFILGCMPFALVVVLYFVDPSHVMTLFGYTIGRWAFSSVIVMVILAQLWIRKLLDIDV